MTEDVPHSKRHVLRLLAICVPMVENPEYPGCNALKYTFSVEDSLTEQEFRAWFKKFMNSPIALKYKSHPEIFKIKPDHDWSKPTLVTVAGVKLQTFNIPVQPEIKELKPERKTQKKAKPKIEVLN